MMHAMLQARLTVCGYMGEFSLTPKVHIKGVSPSGRFADVFFSNTIGDMQGKNIPL